MSEAAAYYDDQRAQDNEPCPVCGGDRLRTDFTASGRCHVSGSTVSQPIIAGAASPEPLEGTK
jgi:hypothetical protein